MTKEETKPYLLFLQSNLSVIIKFIKTFEDNSVDVSKIRQTILKFARHFYYQIMNDRYLHLSEEENFTNYFNAPKKSELLNSIERFEEDFFCNYGDVIDLKLLNGSTRQAFFENVSNYLQNAMIAIEKYFNFKYWKLFELLAIKNRQNISSIAWIETYNRFKRAIGDYTFIEISHEVKDYKSLKEEDVTGGTILEQWKSIRDLKALDKQRFPFLSRTTQVLLTLPFSTAEIERVFSTLKLTKTPLRNRLGDTTLKNILTVKQSLKRKSMHIDQMDKGDLKRVKTLVIDEQNKLKDKDKERITVNLKK